MIRIAIVEDEKVYAEEIAGYCRRYSAEKKTEISSRWFDNPVDFIYLLGFDPLNNSPLVDTPCNEILDLWRYIRKY